MLPCFHVLLFLLYAVATVRSEDQCKKLGTQCKPSGESIWHCTEIGKPPLSEENCKPPEKCIEKDDQVACMKPSSSEVKFKCTGKGEFPDTKDCSRTYICSDGKAEPDEVCNCPGGGDVLPEEGLFCVPDECPREEITCEKGKNGYFILKNNHTTNYYYYCEADDVVQVFEGVQPPEKSQRRVFLREMKNGKECKPFKSSIPEPTPTEKLDPSPKCKQPGELIKTECECDMYQCDKDLVPIRQICRNGMLFSQKVKRCTLGDCDETKCTKRPNRSFYIF